MLARDMMGRKSFRPINRHRDNTSSVKVDEIIPLLLIIIDLGQPSFVNTLATP